VLAKAIGVAVYMHFLVHRDHGRGSQLSDKRLTILDENITKYID